MSEVKSAVLYDPEEGFWIHPGMVISMIGDQRGISTSEELEANQVLAKIPVSSALSSSRILSHPLFSSLSSFLSPSGPSSLSTDDLLALAVHISRTTTLLDDNFTFAKYARFFPSTYKSSIFLAPRSLAHDTLRSTTLLRTTQILQVQIQQDHERLNKLLHSYNKLHPEPHFPVDDEFPLECYVHSLFSVYSRGADISFSASEGDGEDIDRQRMIVPFLDMFNHSMKSTVHYKYNTKEGTIEINTGSSPVPAGAEVHLNYGAVQNSKLLLFYGFTLQQNEADFTEIFVPVPDEIPARAEKIKLLKAAFPEFVPSTAFKLVASGELPPSLLPLLRILPLPSEELPMDVEKPISAKLELSALSALESALLGMSQNIAMSLLEVVGKTKDGGNGIDTDYDFAMIYAESELEILSNTLNIVREMKLKFEGEGDAAVPVKQVEVQEVVKKEEMEAVD